MKVNMLAAVMVVFTACGFAEQYKTSKAELNIATIFSVENYAQSTAIFPVTAHIRRTPMWNVAIKAPRVQMVGDSITEAWQYRCSVYDNLVDGGYTPTFVGFVSDSYGCRTAKNHDGHGGWTSSNLAAQFSQWIPTANPDVIVLMSGVNDLAWWTTETGAQIADRQNSYISQIFTLKPNIRIVIMTLTQLSDASVPPNNVSRKTLVSNFNLRLRTLIAVRVAAGQRIRLVDMASLFTSTNTYDGIHPDESTQINIMGPAASNGVNFILRTP